ncbi:hypothetical protein BJ912DRAFT_1055020 [Pholiota molesta]|nr:hypothetical protein BJ912DRAFT_1055020 [Pholiota molesta]
MKFSITQFFLFIATTATAVTAMPSWGSNDVFIRDEAVPRTGPGYLDINFDGVHF